MNGSGPLANGPVVRWNGPRVVRWRTVQSAQMDTMFHNTPPCTFESICL